MPSIPSFQGHLLHVEAPTWDPLLELIGDRLIRWFMWMSTVELSDGREIQAYKHVPTRRSPHLGNDGSAFAYTQRSRYRQIGHWDAVREAFEGWQDLHPGPDDLD